MPVDVEAARRDEIVEEVRRIREEHAARLGFDLDEIVKDLKTQERGREVVALTPKLAWKAKGAA